ncbi:hypothetical protein RND81_10G248700 [Saponaria officinalis]|uniref:Fatty acid hydroxylase domain-containing protein n=1 Tax=Saponaria officinalis TaxID=3572 RepID=A0AAW1I7E4_SAPOF
MELQHLIKILLTYIQSMLQFHRIGGGILKVKMLLASTIPNEILATLVPILVYWLYAGLHLLLEPIHKYRLHPKNEEDEKNLVPKSSVIKMVLLQQIMQAIIATLVYKGTQDKSIEAKNKEKEETTIITIIFQFIIAMIVLDTCQYFVHRYLHHNKFLYQNVHSVHHRLFVPYAYGAFYNHPFEGLLDIIGGALAHWVSGMTPRTSMLFFSFTTIKAMDDHSGLWLPGNVLHVFFNNNSAYHDVHHQLYGNKYNFSQPFFVMWDSIMGTHMPYSLHKRLGGGFEARPLLKEHQKLL